MSSQSPREHFLALDGLRGFAALVVVLSHLSNNDIHLVPGLNLAGVGKMGVFAFFVLSAFLLTGPFLSKGADALDRDFLQHFVVRRFARVYPLYLLYVFAAFVSTQLLSSTLASVTDRPEPQGVPFDLDAAELARHILLLEGKGLTWSILVEFRYYLLLPFVGLLFGFVLRSRLAACGIATILAVVLVDWLAPASESAVNESSLWPYLPVFFLGSFLAVAHWHWRRSELPRWVQRVPLLVGLLALAVLVAMIPSVYRTLSGNDVEFDHFHKQFLAFGALWSAVLFMVVTTRNPITSFFEHPALRYFGRISFSLYLLHIVVVELAAEGPYIPLLTPLAAIGIATALSHISYLLVERSTAEFG